MTKIELEDGWCLELLPYDPDDPEADRVWWGLKDADGRYVADLSSGDLERIARAVQVRYVADLSSGDLVRIARAVRVPHD